MEDERIIEIETERLRTFQNHPFKIADDQQMAQLVESIKHYGILTPLIIRPLPEGVYEIISGHRRKHAAEQLGYRKVPVVIRVLKDEDAIISMVDSNLQRENITPSEKAFALKMKYDAMKRKSGRRKKGQIDYQMKGKKTVQIVGEESGDSPKQVQRYLKITELIPELLQYLDDQKLSFNPAFELAFLKEEEQRLVLSAIEFTQSVPSLSQAQRIKKLSQAGSLTREKAQDILSEVKKGEVHRVTFKNEQLHSFFPKTDSAETMKRKIIEILKIWYKDQIED
ncbi:MAG: ParB/RepB/Spo0J family partition protein [Blautia sp.]|nr:ParB/RepB/Spo0J family partition protein [Blautia sp.]